MNEIPEQDQATPSTAEARTIPVRLPTGKTFSIPAWMASAMLEGLLRHDRQVYARHMMAIKTGSDPKDGRKRGSDAQ